MKNCFIFILFVGVITNLYATNARSILLQAFSKSATANIKAELDNPIPPAPQGLKILPYSKKWIFYRNCAEENLNLRVDFIGMERGIEKNS